jgi:hypothetical protein
VIAVAIDPAAKRHLAADMICSQFATRMCPQHSNPRMR